MATNSWANMSETAWDAQSDDGSFDSLELEGSWAKTESDQSLSSMEKVQVEIALSASVESSLCRRGRRRFRELQASSSAKIRFDRARAVLKVVGTESEILSVRRKLECLGGVRKVVPTAVWCELMRTRLDVDAEKSMLQQMQAQSGCRIHIERSLQEVRLFGPDENTSHGLQLIEAFCERCTEASVPAESDAMPDSVVQALTDAFQVTVNVEKRQVKVYGIREAVAQAASEVESYLKTGSLSLLATADTDDEAESDDGTSSSSAATWCDASVCHEPSTPVSSECSSCSISSQSFAAEEPAAHFAAAEPKATFLEPVAVPVPMQQMPVQQQQQQQPMMPSAPAMAMCYMPAAGVPPMCQAILVPAGMVLAPMAMPVQAPIFAAAAPSMPR